MIEIKYYYQKLNGIWYQAYKTFYRADKALRFLYKCKSSPRLVYDGDIACDDPLDFEYIQRRFK